MNKFTKFFALALVVLSFQSCLKESHPIHVIAEVQNLDRENTSISYISGTDTLLTKMLSEDTIQTTPFENEMTIVLKDANHTYTFDKIPPAYLNDLGRMSVTRKIYQEDIFPTEWADLKNKNIDYVTLKFIASPTNRFTIVLDANTEVEIGRYFEKLN